MKTFARTDLGDKLDLFGRHRYGVRFASQIQIGQGPDRTSSGWDDLVLFFP